MTRGFDFIPQINITSLFTGGTFAIVAVALIRAWPVLALQIQKAKQTLRAEDRADLSDCKQRLDLMNQKVGFLYGLVNNLKIELAGVVAAYRILEVAEARRDPDSLHLAQARAILSTAFSVAPSTMRDPFAADYGVEEVDGVAGDARDEGDML